MAGCSPSSRAHGHPSFWRTPSHFDLKLLEHRIKVYANASLQGSAWVLREMPKWVKNRYDSVKQLPIFITENGIKTQGDSPLDDWDSRAVYCSVSGVRTRLANSGDAGT